MGDELRFDGRVAVVTGAGRGIGRAHAHLLAVLSLTLTLAQEGAEHRIQVNAIAPAAFTRMADAVDRRFYGPELVEQLRATGDPNLVASVAAYLVHESCD